jgi:glycosyltransferase involved in cell wall biosynthesis
MPRNQAAKSEIPFFSVIMCSHNNAATVDAAIQSILNQSFRNYELLLIDDGSTDQTGTIMSHYASRFPGISFLENLKNIGKPLSMNLGVLSARGEYIAIADADDIWLSEKLSRQFDYLLKYPGTDVLGGQLIRFGEWGKSHNPTELPLKNSVISDSFKRGQMAINNPTAVIRKSSFLSAGAHRGYFLRTEDFDLFLRMNKLGFTFANLPEVLIEYRTTSRIQTLRYWSKAEFGKQQILLANSSRLLRVFPLLRLPMILRDLLKLIVAYFKMQIRERNV